MNFLFNRTPPNDKYTCNINICYLAIKIYCLVCFDKNTKHRRAFSFRDMHKAFNVKIRVTCIISVNKMRCDKWFSLLLPFHLDSTNSYLTISIQIEEKKLHLFWVWFKGMMLGHLWAVHSTPCFPWHQIPLMWYKKIWLVVWKGFTSNMLIANYNT